MADLNSSRCRCGVVIDPNHASCRLSAVQYVTGIAQINTHVSIYIYIEYITYIDNALEVI